MSPFSEPSASVKSVLSVKPMELTPWPAAGAGKPDEAVRGTGAGREELPPFLSGRSESEESWTVRRGKRRPSCGFTRVFPRNHPQEPARPRIKNLSHNGPHETRGRRCAGAEHHLKPQRGVLNPAQGNALGHPPRISQALKGRHPPAGIRASYPNSIAASLPARGTCSAPSGRMALWVHEPQGVALGCILAPLWGYGDFKTRPVPNGP